MAEHLENLSLKEQVCLFRHLPADEAAEALAELDQEVAVDVLENLDPDEAAQIIAEMSPDDAADVLDELEEGHRDVLLSNLDRDDAEELRNLLAFDPDTAGGIMNTEIILLEQDITVDEAISLIRRGMAAGLLLGLTRALGEVGMSLMLGGNIAGRTNTLSLEIFNSVSTGEYRRAAALCLLLGLVSLLLYLAVELCQNKRGT